MDKPWNRYPTRDFQFWAYRVSFGLALIRSPSKGEGDHNVDLVFYGVKYLSLPSVLGNIQVAIAHGEEAENLRALLRPEFRADGNEAFVIEEGSRKHYVLAAGCDLYENWGDLFDDTLQRIVNSEPSQLLRRVERLAL